MKENKFYEYIEYDEQDKKNCRGYPFYTVREILKNRTGYEYFEDMNVYKGGCHNIGWGCEGYKGELKRDLYESIHDFNDFKIKACEVVLRDMERSNVTTKIGDKKECEKYPFYTFRIRPNFTHYEDYEYFQDNCHRQKWNCKGGEIVISSDIKEEYIAVNDEKNLCEIAIHNFEIANNATQSFSRNIFIYSQILFLTLFFLFTS